MNDNNGLDFETDSMDESQNQTNPPSLQNNPEMKDISRNSFRLPIEKIGTVEVTIGEHTLDLVNIVVDDRTGIGVRVFRGDIFTRDQKLPIIQFKLLDQDFSFQGEVQHISPDMTGHYLCGILLTHLTDEERSTLKTMAHKLHSKIFR